MGRVPASLDGSALGVAVLAGAASAQESATPVVVDPSAPPASILITTVSGSDVYSSGGQSADGGGGTLSLGDITVGPDTTLIVGTTPPPTAPAPTPPEDAPLAPLPAPAPAPPPGDADGDNLADDAEAAYGTNPSDPDTDGDGVADGDEIYGYNPVGAITDPLAFATDRDGRGDGEELFFTFTYPSVPDAPVAASGAPANLAPAAPPTQAPAGDRDNDNLPDADEAAAGTNPASPDTDGDGRTDSAEVFGTFTDPVLPDPPAPAGAAP